MSKAEEVEEKLSDIRRNADRNRAIQAMMTDGEQLKTFYRFVANNPHIPLHDACQIVIQRPDARVCFSFEEWNAQGRRVKAFGGIHQSNERQDDNNRFERRLANRRKT